MIVTLLFNFICLCSIFYGAVATSSQPGYCLSLREDRREIIDAREILNNEQNVVECLTLSLRKGRMSQAKTIIDLYDTQYSQQIASVIQKQLRRLELIQEDIIDAQSNCTPVMKWGQNMTHIFLSMKMSHRWDSPPCLHTKNQSVTLSKNYFQYINVCLVSHQKINFNVSLSLFQQVVGGDVEVRNDGVGTYSVIFQKRESKVWTFLANNQIFYPIWDEIAERYNPVHKEYTDLVENILRQRKSKPVEIDSNRTRREKQQQTKIEPIDSEVSSQAKDTKIQQQNQTVENRADEIIKADQQNAEYKAQ